MKGTNRRGLRHYTAVVLTIAMILGQSVPVSAYEEQLITDEDTLITEESTVTDAKDDVIEDTDLTDSGLLEETPIAEELTDEGGVLSEDVIADEELSLSDDIIELTDEALDIIEEDDDLLRDGDYRKYYDFDAALLDVSNNRYPGVYVVTPTASSNGTIGIPSIANDNIADKPTTESPAIITGAAVPYEKKVGPVDFRPIEGAQLYAPYSYFRYEKMEEAGTDGTIHTKLSGYDGTYYIIRVDVSDIIKYAPDGSYLHVKHDHNKALMVRIGMENETGMATFCDAGGSKTGSYQISGNQLVHKDADGDFQTGSFVDVIFMSSGTLVQGADTGTELDPQAPRADFGLSFYIDNVGDYNPDITWNSNLGTAVMTATGDPVTLTSEQTQAGVTTTDLLLNKYFDETKTVSENISKYTVKGSDIDIDTMIESSEKSPTASGKTEFWALSKGMGYKKYDDHTLKLICEAPLLGGLKMEGADRKVVLDVNSFDIQLANHKDKGTAAITVDSATLTIMDSSNTTGAELAVGNNAHMEVKNNGRLIIDETTQLEVEYDSASVSAGEVIKDLDVGVMSVNTGGVIENHGVITVEGKEGKPQDAADAQTVVRDYRNAILTIDNGGTLENYGCMLVNGEFYNMGTVKNYGKYEEVIISGDPDKGTFTYHKGIQLSWKDDIIQGHTIAGEFYNGKDSSGGSDLSALVENKGDIVMIPGHFENFARINNKGNIIMCAVDEVIIPIKAYADQPLVREERVKLGYFEDSIFFSEPGSSITNSGSIKTAEIAILSNGRTGDITADVSRDLEGLSLRSYGNVANSGTIALNALYAVSTVTNTGNGVIDRIVLCDYSGGHYSGKFTDSSKTKNSKVYNGARSGSKTYTWTYAGTSGISISDETRFIEDALPGQTVEWSVTGRTGNTGNDILYSLVVYDASPFNRLKTYDLKANTPVRIESPELPNVSGNRVYYLYLEEEISDINTGTAVVRVNGTGLMEPTAMQDLVYNGQQLPLVTPGSFEGGKIQYHSKYNGIYSDISDTPPIGKDAGNYTVFWEAIDSSNKTVSSGSIPVTIEKRTAYIAADDHALMKGKPKAELGYVSYGIVPGDDLGIITSCAGLKENIPGSYEIEIGYTSNNNYNVKTYKGTYTVMDTESDNPPGITGQSVMGAFDNREGTVSVNIAYESRENRQKVLTYYSLDTPLTADNYKTAGTTIAPSYGGIGVQTMYYYVYTPDGCAGGCQRVVKPKADQNPPDKLSAAQVIKGMAVTLSGNTPRKTEYRRVDEDTYTRAMSDMVSVLPGRYLVRFAGDERYNPSPDVILDMPVEKTATVKFDSCGGSPVADATDLSWGDRVPKPADPVRDGYKFDHWYMNPYTCEEYDFDSIVTEDYMGQSPTLYAMWTRVIPGASEGDNDTLIADIGDGSLSSSETEEGGISTNTVTLSGAEISRIKTDQDGKVTVDSMIWIGGLRESYTYTGLKITPAIHVYDGVKLLTEKTDYTLSYKNNKEVGHVGDSAAPEIRIKFKGSYKSKTPVKVKFNIDPAELEKDIDVHDMSVTAKNGNKAQKPVPVISMTETGKRLKASQFIISYDRTVSAPGIYTVTVKPRNENYKGVASANIIVREKAAKNRMLEKAKVKFTPSYYYYTGKEIVPSYSSCTLKIGKNKLTADVDYEIKEIYNNREPGKATVVFAAVEDNKAGYTGSVTATFKIKKGRKLTDASKGEFTYEYESDLPYLKGGVKPAVRVYDNGVLLKKNVDYRVTYRRYNLISTESKAATATVKGIGKYKGKVDLTYRIHKQNINDITLYAVDQFTGSKAYKNKVKLVVKDKNGKNLNSSDYKKGEPVVSGNIVTVEVYGREIRYTGKKTLTFRLLDESANIGKSRIKNKIPDQVYSGRPVTLSRNDLKNVLFTGKKTSPNYLVYNNSPETDDFEILEYSKNTKTGTAKVTVRGINKMGGIRTISFKIKSKNPVYDQDTFVLIGGIWRKISEALTH